MRPVPAAAHSRLETTNTQLSADPAETRRHRRAAEARRRAEAAARRATSMAQMSEIHPGDVLAGRYCVTTVLGRGRGLLLDAKHTSFDQRVVARVISPALADAKAVDRFQRETRILSQLETEHVARIIDVGTLPNGALFLVREYLEGVSLAEHSRSNKMQMAATVDLFLQVCEVVQEAHSRGVVLRDLQGEHVFVSHKRNGEPIAKITDFGTCKVMRQEDTDEQSCTKLLGLSSSASPELVRQVKVIDERSDVWSLACILYQMLTGVPVFQGDGVMLMLSIANDEPVPPSSLRRDINIPAAVDQAIMQALSKNRSQRFQTVYQFAAALRPFASASGELLIKQIARLAGEELTAPSVKPYVDSDSAGDSSDDSSMTFTFSLRPSEPPPSYSACAPFPLATPSRALDPSAALPLAARPSVTPTTTGIPAAPPSVPAAPPSVPAAPGSVPQALPSVPHTPLSMGGPVPMVPPSMSVAHAAASASISQSVSAASASASQPLPAVLPSSPALSLPINSHPSGMVPGSGSHGVFGQASYPPVVASGSHCAGDIAEQTAEFGLDMLNARGRAVRSALVAGAIALTPIAIVLFIFALANSSADAEVAQSSEGSTTSPITAAPIDVPATPAVVAPAEDAEEPSTEDVTLSYEDGAGISVPPTASKYRSSKAQFFAAVRAKNAAAAKARAARKSKKSKKRRGSKSSGKSDAKSNAKSNAKGTIVAMAVGASCRFAIDGAGRGASSSVRVQVAPGRHTVSCQPLSGSTRSKSVTVEPGKAAVAVFKF